MSSDDEKTADFPAESQNRISTMLCSYETANDARRSGIMNEGMPYLGECSAPEWEEFQRIIGHKYPLLAIPSTRSDFLHTWLLGDPTGVHESTAKIFDEKIVNVIKEVGMDWKTKEGLLTCLSDHCISGGSPTGPINVRIAGKIGDRDIKPGVGEKAPDAVFSSFLHGEIRDNLVIEVAYSHETPAELFFEGLLWSQQGSATNYEPICRPAMFIGIHIERGRSFQMDESLGAAWAIMVLSAADSDGIGTSTITLINATEKYLAKVRNGVAPWADAHCQVAPTFDHASEIRVLWRWMCPSISPHLQDMGFQLTSEDLVTALRKGEGRNHAQTAATATRQPRQKS